MASPSITRLHIESRYRSGPNAGAVKMLAQMSYK